MPSKQALTLLEAIYPNGHPRFLPLCFEEMELHSKKNADYACGGDPLGNFKRVSEILAMWGIELQPHALAWVYMMKQVDAVGRMIGKNYDGDFEGIIDKLKDISIYAKLTRILYEHG